jgi:hypothetical protein
MNSQVHMLSTPMPWRFQAANGLINNLASFICHRVTELTIVQFNTATTEINVTPPTSDRDNCNDCGA